MEWYVKLGSLIFLAIIGIPYIVQKFKPPKPGKESDYAHIDPKPDETGPLIISVDTEPQHPDVTRLRKKQ